MQKQMIAENKAHKSRRKSVPSIPIAIPSIKTIPKRKKKGAKNKGKLVLL
jgi:hypothetical protein